ncbi:MAG: acetylxylan esterase [Planctomycetes bacterium]|nr:acetylxylan esterase [Planctomycetota bacterium]
MRPPYAILIACAAFVSVAADFKDVDPNVFPKDDPRAKELPKMMWADARNRMQEANLRESKAFAEVTTKEQWAQYRDARIQKLKESLGTFPDVPKDIRIMVTRRLDGEGYVIHNIVYETRPGLWVSANLYLPATVPDKMPGIIISHAHHTPKTHGELQDMGMTWARSGVAVLVPDHLGHGERRQHDFVTEKDYDKPFRASRQDYYFRYNSNLQLSAAGESLMGWMVWDLMRGVDVLLRQKNIDKDRIIMLGAVAGGGDPAGVTAALDERIACVVPFNFGGWQPESSATENPDRDAPWFGDGYWESTRGLRNGARDGFAHFVIVGSVAPRPVIYAHEFAWDAKTDPAWPRLQKIFDFYGARDKLVSVHGKGSVKGAAGPDNTHCTHIGAVHRKGIYPALKEWFGMPIPEEYSKRRTAEDLTCWTPEAEKELKPKKLHEILRKNASDRVLAEFKETTDLKDEERRQRQRTVWAKLLGNIEPPANPKVAEGKAEDVPDGRLTRFALETEPGIIVPLLLITPKSTNGPVPVFVMVAQDGKAGFLKERGAVIAAFLNTGVAVCLADVRGTGETRSANSADRGSSRTSVSQTNLILGQPVLGAQLRDLRAVIRWLAGRKGIDGKRIGVWGDSLAGLNKKDDKLAVPLDANLPHIAEPGGGSLALLAALFEENVRGVYVGARIEYAWAHYLGPYLYLPHDSIVPGGDVATEMLDMAVFNSKPLGTRMEKETNVSGLNWKLTDKPLDRAKSAKALAESVLRE